MSLLVIDGPHMIVDMSEKTRTRNRNEQLYWSTLRLLQCTIHEAHAGTLHLLFLLVLYIDGTWSVLDTVDMILL